MAWLGMKLNYLANTSITTEGKSDVFREQKLIK